MLDDFMRDFLRSFFLWIILPTGAVAVLGYLAEVYLVPKPYEGVTLQRGVVYVSARRFEKNGLEALQQNADAISLVEWPSVADSGAIESDVTILVHGYNAQEPKVASYFAGLIDTLLEGRGHRGSIIVFDWPAVGVPFDELPFTERAQRDIAMGFSNRNSQPAYELAMYGIDRRHAEDVGAKSFVALLASLSHIPRPRITIVGHSMGCHLLLHALLQDPQGFRNVGAMYWLAPDVDVAAVKDPAFLSAIDAVADGLYIHYSANDAVLAHLSRIANLSQRLGAVGPGSDAITAGKLHFIDMTAELGHDGVHGGYLKKDSRTAHLIAARIQGR